MNPARKTPLLARLALLLASAGSLPGCSDEDAVSDPGALGTACEFTDESTCKEGLSCVEGQGGDGVCAISLGLPCDAESSEVENGGCGLGADCVEPGALETPEEAPLGGSSGEGEAVCVLKEGSLCVPEQPQCGRDFICAETRTEQHRCFGRVALRGRVSDASDGSAIEGAEVTALDEEGSTVPGAAATEADGSYVLELPVVRNDEDGTPIETTFTLKCDAQDYAPFPSGDSEAPPIQAADAVRQDNLYVIEGQLTDVGLDPI